MKPILLALLLLLLSVTVVSAQDADTRHYDIGAPTLVDVWVDPYAGNDLNAGDTPQTALRTITEAWNRIPMGVELTTGYHIHLQPDEYPEDTIPVYWESRYGTYEHPIIIDGNPATVLLAPINLFDSRYVYFFNFRVSPGVDAFHCERCDHVLLGHMMITGADPQTFQSQETVKFNQSTHIYIEESFISGAWDNALDFVAVQHGHVIQSMISNAGDWCVYAKGGSAYLTYEANMIFNCGTGGFSAGQGTGFQFMVPPFLHYEAYYIRFLNNSVYGVDGAGVGVQGGFNVLIAYNTFESVGARSHLLEVVFGGRSCDGQPGDEGRERCDEYAAQGGWGNNLLADGENYVRIPNRHVYIYNNVFYNPDAGSQWQQFTIFGPFTGGGQGNAPSPALADDDLRIVNNVIWNGPADHPLGLGENSGCAADNPICNETQLLRDNAINTLPINPDGTVTNYASVPLPPFVADDDHVPPPQLLENVVGLDINGAVRTEQAGIGAVGN
ncbi:MAG: right-handed parallel beta-helix repeat-containing protein [Anaerolineae bacterium]|nr:right-handed parallel beta-helix repeat-containing protein [Anaerolineae bacterium]